MSKVELQKIRIAGVRSHYDVLAKELQRKGVLHIEKNPDFYENSTFKSEDLELVDDFDLARVEFAINYLSPYEKKKGKLDSLLRGGKIIMSEKEAKDRFENFEPKLVALVEECEKMEENAARYENEIVNLNKKIAKIEKFAGFYLPIGDKLQTDTTVSVVGSIATSKKDQFLGLVAKKTNLVDIDVFFEDKKEMFFRLTYFFMIKKEVEKSLHDVDFNEVDLMLDFEDFSGKEPRKVMEFLQNKVKDYQSSLGLFETKKKDLANSLEDLKIAYDFYKWKKDKDDLQKNVFQSKVIFAFEAWVAKNKFASLKDWIFKAFAGDVIVEKIEKKAEEKAPALLKNSSANKSFQMITEMYGAPQGDDIDPTPGLTPFFIAFFGICLSDTGYGMILFLIASFFLLFGKFSKEARVSLWMIFLLGVSATIGGVLLGGHFGMTSDQAPAFLTVANEAGDLVFKGQILDPMKGTGPMIFLLATFGIGVLQLLFGLVMRFVKLVSQKKYFAAFADAANWFFFILFLIGWALADNIGLPKNVMLYGMMFFMMSLVLTQGREKSHKNPIVSIILKLVFGILGLYGIMDYVSSTLSYSRLMALGLATGIIGSAMNMTAGVLGNMVPGVGGIIIMIFFLIFGHSINFGLSAMGAFIHSMRLQFIEFFGVFYRGGAELFKPFARVKKYLLFRS